MATKFVFRLQRLLELRERKVEECKKSLALAIQEVNRAAAEVARLQGEQTRLNRSWREETQHGLAPDLARCFQRCVVALVQLRKAAEEIAAAAKAKESVCRSHLAQALTKQKALEKLRARLRARHSEAALKREQAELDDFAVIRAAQEER